MGVFGARRLSSFRANFLGSPSMKALHVPRPGSCEITRARRPFNSGRLARPVTYTMSPTLMAGCRAPFTASAAGLRGVAVLGGEAF